MQGNHYIIDSIQENGFFTAPLFSLIYKEMHIITIYGTLVAIKQCSYCEEPELFGLNTF